jgi:hypothetical protein
MVSQIAMAPAWVIDSIVVADSGTDEVGCATVERLSRVFSRELCWFAVSVACIDHAPLG